MAKNEGSHEDLVWERSGGSMGTESRHFDASKYCEGKAPGKRSFIEAYIMYRLEGPSVRIKPEPQYLDS